MASDLTSAVDETAANMLFHHGESALGTRTASGSTSFGPFGAAYSAAATLSGGTVRLVAPGTVAVDDITIAYSLSLTVSLDLSFLDFCLPRICVPTPFGDICTPKICVSFPTISLTVPFSSTADLSADFGLSVALLSGDWVVSVVVQSVRKLDIGGAATALVAAIGAAVALALSAIPFIGPFLGAAVALVTAAFGIASVAGLLGDVVNLFVAGLTVEVARHAQTFAVPASGPYDPAIPFTITALAAAVQASDENELVLTADL